MDDQLKGLVDIDRMVHEPARLAILTILWAVDSADFLYLLNATNLTRGNLSSHLNKLEEAGYIHVHKSFEGKMPRTTCRLSAAGQDAFEKYRAQMVNLLGSSI